MNNFLVAGNATMPTSAGIFNLPAMLTCTPSGWCQEHCYALRGRFRWKCVKEALEWRYQQSLLPDFVSKMIDELSHRKSIRFVRIHISGDFYSREYVHRWADIAKEFPNTIFRTNTKRQDLVRCMKRIFPWNVVVRESVDDTRISTGVFPLAAIKGTVGAESFFVCQDNCEACEFYCWHHPAVNVVTSKIR